MMSHCTISTGKRAMRAALDQRLMPALISPNFARWSASAIQPGRTAYVVVHALLPPDTALDLAAADRLRGAVIAALAARHAPVIVDVVFTGVEGFAAPTTGYRSEPR